MDQWVNHGYKSMHNIHINIYINLALYNIYMKYEYTNIRRHRGVTQYRSRSSFDSHIILFHYTVTLYTNTIPLVVKIRKRSVLL